MFEQLIRLLKNTFFYSTEDILEKAVGFFLIPVYTAYLIPEEYGIIVMMSTFVSVLSTFYISGLQGAAVRYYFYYEEPEKRSSYYGALFTYLLIIPLFLSLPLLYFGEAIFSRAFQGIPFYPFGFMAVITAYFAGLLQLRLSLWVAGEKPLQTVIFNFSKFLLYLFLALFFVVGLRLGAYGKLLGGTITSGIFWLAGAIFLLKEVKPCISLDYIKKSLSFGLPLIPHTLALMVLSASDRYMLEYFMGLDHVGIYSLGYSLGSIIFFISLSFDKSWYPFFFSRVEKKEGKKIFSKIATYFFSFTMFATFILSIFAREIVSIMADPSYFEAYRVMPLVALGLMFNSFYLIPVKAVLYHNKTRLIPFITGAAALVNILLNLVMIPYMGIMGAAWATIVGYCFLFILVLIFSQGIYPINYEKKRLICFITVMGAAYAIYYAIFEHYLVNLSAVYMILLKGILVLLVLPVLYLLKFFEQEETDCLRRLFTFPSKQNE